MEKYNREDEITQAEFKYALHCAPSDSTSVFNGSIAFSAQFTFSVDSSCALPLAML
jgi:hypothetical protein